MFNMIKAETKRLFKSKSFLVAISIYLLIYGFYFYMLTSLQSQIMDSPAPKESINSTQENGVGFSNESGLYISIGTNEFEEGMEDGMNSTESTLTISLNEIVKDFSISVGVLVFGIYLISFICNEYSSGYIKNTVMLEEGRSSVIISKLAVSAIISLLVIIFNYIACAIIGKIFLDNFIIESPKKLISFASIIFILSLALYSLVIFICTVTRNKAISIVTFFLIATDAITPLLSKIFDLFHIPSAINYTLTYFFNASSDIYIDFAIRILYMSIIYILVYNIFSVIILKKRDI
ncbi:MAG: hypothetical protein SOY42_08570 [Clostridium sp.]|nr:hypothetical protein [Clostridium sp.]